MLKTSQHYRVQWMVVTINFVSFSSFWVPVGPRGPEDPLSLGIMDGSGKVFAPTQAIENLPRDV